MLAPSSRKINTTKKPAPKTFLYFLCWNFAFFSARDGKLIFRIGNFYITHPHFCPFFCKCVPKKKVVSTNFSMVLESTYHTIIESPNTNEDVRGTFVAFWHSRGSGYRHISSKGLQNEPKIGQNRHLGHIIQFLTYFELILKALRRKMSISWPPGVSECNKSTMDIFVSIRAFDYGMIYWLMYHRKIRRNDFFGGQRGTKKRAKVCVCGGGGYIKIPKSQVNF